MTKLTKEDVISQLEAALSKREGKAISIEQSGSWYKIDGEKSVRFAELEQMLAELDAPEATAPQSATKAKPAKAPVAKAQTAAPTAAAKGNAQGKTPKQLWREKLAQQAGNTLPRGF
ncbi:hypothetical protein L9G74_09305 [Shewanella sp. C32]|uniref:Uncharacterized protein n=1 Tax=Shewanella electrica TaxID=515560 RepID=A0ABT2FLY2_9GAMM|nr:hypothetical protein [Shewanella electrica]MCH1924920.1 hypothetical protein [Shewanella electrica]MCS4556635.1 hypothetical protein [Shewanella electrica]